MKPLEEAEGRSNFFYEETEKKFNKIFLKTTENQRLPWRHRHHPPRRRRPRPGRPLCCVLRIKKKKPNLETRGENHPKAFIIPEGEGV